MLTPKQNHIVETAKVVFGSDKVLEFTEAIERKLKSMPEIELLDLLPEKAVADLLNDVIYNLADNNLFSKFVMPPFSVLDTKGGKWLERRRILNEYLGSSLVGRADGLVYGSFDKRREAAANGKRDPLVGLVRADDNGTSQFDSVLCEILLKWFGFKSCAVLDPFAGGHIRGAMAALLDYNYTGIDLSKEQVDANIKRAAELGLANKINWINDDAANVSGLVADNSADLVFTCPPYGDLEKYTDDPRDLSNMGYEDFYSAYSYAIGGAIKNKLKDNRFAVIVVGDFRDEKGFYRGFVADTIKIAEAAGGKLYNEIILLNSIGTAGMRASNMFSGNRKVVKVHQNVLVFYKGDPSKIKELYGNTIDSKLPIPAPPKEEDMLF
jgi:DNA modification methylase